MTLKRPRTDEESDELQTKKIRTGFKVGPENLPDGTWRRKVIKIKKDLIHNAKVKKSYAKIIAREPPKDIQIPEEASNAESSKSPASQALHPERQAMLDSPDSPYPPRNSSHRRDNQRRPRKPQYFEKEQNIAAKKKEELEARQRAMQERESERQQKIQERERFRSAMAKARKGGRNGQRKLGRESNILLEKVKRIVGAPP